MAVNPSIPLAIEPTPYLRMPDPWQTQARAFALRELMRNEELDRIKLEELRRQRDEEQAIREIFRRHVTPEGKLNRQGALADLYRLNPTTALNMQKNWLAQEKALSDAEEARLKADAARAARLGSLAGSATDQASYDRAIKQAVDEGLLTSEQAAQLPRVWDDSTRALTRQFQEQALSAQQQIEAAIKRAQEERARALHEVQLPGVQAEAAGKAFRLAGQLAPGAAHSASDWTALRAMLPAHLRRIFPTVPFTGAVEIAEQLGTPPDERRQAEDRAATRRETERHHKAMEDEQRQRRLDRTAREGRQESQRAEAERRQRLRQLQDEEQKLDAEQTKLDERRRELGQILSSYPSYEYRKTTQGKTKKFKLSAEERAARQAEYETATERWQKILDRKKQIQDERRSLQGGSQQQGPPAPASRAAQVPIDFSEEDLIRRARQRGMTQEQIDRALAEYRAARAARR